MKTSHSCISPLLQLVLAIGILNSGNLSARTWTSADGRTIEAELISATATAVTVKKQDGKTVTIDLAKLSQGDQDFVKTQPVKPVVDQPAVTTSPTPITGPYASHVTSDWSEFEGRGGLKCMLFAGKDLDADTKHPLLIYLHGKGNRVLTKEHLGFGAACAKPENYKKNPCFIMAPQCPDENGWGGATGANFLKTLRDIVKNLPVDEDRIYLSGYSMGGFGTFALLNQEPKLFAAGVPIAGGADVAIARNLRRIPLWIFHGEKDDVVKPDGSRAIAKALDKVKTVRYTEIPGAGHGIGGDVEKNAELHKWLFEQKRGK